jgi:hypothetical protein
LLLYKISWNLLHMNVLITVCLLFVICLLTFTHPAFTFLSLFCIYFHIFMKFHLFVYLFIDSFIHTHMYTFKGNVSLKTCSKSCQPNFHVVGLHLIIIYEALAIE